MSGAVLEAQQVTAGYGETPIIDSVDLHLDEREIVVIIGPNGAGKSTLLKAIFGLNRRFSGDILLRDKSIFTVAPADLVPLGISAVPQTRNVFPSLTVAENLDIGTYAHPPANKEESRERVLSLFPDMRDKLKQQAGELSGGQRQMVAVGRALMSDPDILLLDEPTAGLSPANLELIFDFILQIRDRGVSILMVEQNAKQALAIADRGYVLVNGQNAFEGTGKDLLADEDVRRSFLGGGATP